MAYIVPKVLIKQEFTQAAVFADNPLSALVFGPQYDLHRYNVVAERPFTAVTNPDDASLKNAYQKDSDVVYAFPNQTPGTYVDAAYTKVIFENAKVEYFPDTDLGSTGSAIGRVEHPIFAGQYFSNRFIADSLVFKTANNVDRSSDFSNRDVSLGDYIVIRDVDNSEKYTVRVKGLHASRTSATLSSGSADADNKGAQSESHNHSLVYVNPGSNGAVTVAPSNTSTAYKGYASKGIISDVYVAEVTTPGNLSTARFKITTTNSAFAAKTNVALDGDDILVLDTANNNNVRADFSSIARDSGTLLQLGDKWTLSVSAPVVAVTPTSSGTYTGPENLVYKLKVVRGGPFYSGTNADVCCRVSVTSDGADSSQAVNVTQSSAFRVGSYGAHATFGTASNNGGLILGDSYYITATAAADDAVNIIETYETLPAALLSNDDEFEISSMQFSATLEIPAVNPADEDIVNWSVDTTNQSITINQGITATNADITHAGGDLVALDILAGDIFVTHRDLVITNSISIGSVTAEDQVEAALGTVHPDNPLAQGVYDAALNANGAPTYYCGVASDDLDGYNGVLALARKDDYYYGLAPLTFDPVIQDAVVAHVNAMSTPENAKWRVAWLSSPLVESKLIYDKQEDGMVWKATITDDPFATGTQYTLVTMPGATFLTDGVRATDKLLINFTTKPSGEVVSDEFTVASVRTETTLVLVSGPATAINVAQKAQVKRVFTKDEQIDSLRHVGSDYNNRRVRAVFPPSAKDGDVVKPGYFVSAALAGLRAGVVPHQGLTNTQLLGFTDLTLAVNTFTDIQLNRLAEQGYWIVTQQVVGATPYVRHQLTTDSSSLNTSEDSITTNVDSISYGLQRAISPYIGKYNIHPGTIRAVRAAINGELDYRATNTYTVRAGNQLYGFTIVRLIQDPTFKDRLICDVQLDVPYPLNFITLTLFV